VYFVFILQGIGMNLPWNVFITAVSYFHARLATTAVADTFENTFSFTYTLSNLLFMLAVVMNARQSFFNMRGSVVIPQTITALIFAASTALVYIDVYPNTFFSITVLFVSFTGVSAALVQSGIFGLAGRFPPIYTQAVMAGQGIAGVIVSCTSLVTALSTPCITFNETNSTIAPSSSSSSSNNNNGPQPNDSVKSAAFEYFLASTVVVVLTVVAFLYLSWNDFGKFYAFAHNDKYDEIIEQQQQQQQQQHQQHQASATKRRLNSPECYQALGEAAAYDDVERRPSPSQAHATPSSVLDDALDEALLKDLSQLTPKSRARSYSLLRRQSILDSPVFHTSGSRGDSSRVSSNALPTSSQDAAQLGDEDTSLPTCTLMSMIGRHCFSVCFTFLVTLSVFPGITSEIRSEFNPTNARCPSNGVSRFPYGAGVWQSSFFLIFNVGDTLGRALASIGGIVPHRFLWLVSVSRVAFIPLLLLCNINTGSGGGGSGGGGGNSSRTPSSSLSLYGGHPAQYNSNLVGTTNWDYLEEESDSVPTTAIRYFAHDIYPICFMCLLAVSNGFVASLEMMHTPNLVPKREASRAGAIMAFFLVMGLVCGSVCSFGVRAIACWCNPFE